MIGSRAKRGTGHSRPKCVRGLPWTGRSSIQNKGLSTIAVACRTRPTARIASDYEGNRARPAGDWRLSRQYPRDGSELAKVLAADWCGTDRRLQTWAKTWWTEGGAGASFAGQTFMSLVAQSACHIDKHDFGPSVEGTKAFHQENGGL